MNKYIGKIYYRKGKYYKFLNNIFTKADAQNKKIIFFINKLG